MEDKKVLLSIKDLWVKFRVRGRVLTAIRNVSLDIYENESIAIVGESGCGKSVLTKTFAGMLDNNGFKGAYLMQSFGTSELGGKLAAEGNRRNCSYGKKNRCQCRDIRAVHESILLSIN